MTSLPGIRGRSVSFSGDFAKIIVNAGKVLGPHTLTVTKAGNGQGTVTSSPAGINCGVSCSALYTSGTSVTLTATPSSATFVGWSAPAVVEPRFAR